MTHSYSRAMPSAGSAMARKQVGRGNSPAEALRASMNVQVCNG